MSDDLSASLQTNVLTLALYDDKHSGFIRSLVPHDLLEGLYFEIGSRCYRFIDRYGKPPKDHIYDLFADILEGDDTSRAELFGEALDELQENSENVDANFVLSKIKFFIQEQEIKKAILKGADILSEGDDEEDKIERIKSLFANATKTQTDLFDPGIQLTDYDRSLSFLDDIEIEFPTGIKELDYRGITPTRQELFLFLGVYGAGKSHFIVNLARHALIHNKKVCHISLEMNESRVAQRYFQNILGITKRGDQIRLPQLEVDDDGKLTDIWFKNIEPKLNFTDPEIKSKIIQKTDKLHRLVKNLVVKGFPTSTLTINQLKAYLDMLEQGGFTPDLLIIDYIDLMSLPSDQDSMRVALGQLTKELRGIAGERNCAVVSPSQINREGKKSKKIRGQHISEDYSKLMTGDNVLIYQQSEAEEELGLARIWVDKARYDEKMEILITQNYAMSQFCRDSHLMSKDYHSILESMGVGDFEE